MKKVVKFGGSSLASAEQFIKVGNIIRADKERAYVVPSAPGKRFSNDTKVTDMLYGCYALADEDKDFSKELAAIKARYQEIIDGLHLELSLEEEFKTIEKNFKAKAGSDYAASRGEYLNGIIMADYLGYEFIDSAEVIFFKENGEFDADLTDEVLSARLEECTNAVVPGFYGAYADGRVKTFSRGGSDITGSIVAKAVKADVYENWTDVSGFLIADPRIIKDPQVIEVITYKELRELSYMGASVLHEDAIFPVREVNIPINIRNTNEPDNPGTIISDTPAESDDIITGIAGRKDFVVIALYKNMMNSEIGFVKRLLTILENNEISFEHLPSGIDTVCIVISKQQLEGKLQDLLEDIEKRLKPDSVEIYQDMALIATVGLGMNRRPGVCATLFGALNDAGVNVRMIDQGSSEMNIIVGVENDSFEAAIRSIYNAFVNK